MTAHPTPSIRQFSLLEALVLVTLVALLVGAWQATGLLSVLLWFPAAGVLQLRGRRSLLSIAGTVLVMGMLAGSFLSVCILPFLLLAYVIGGDSLWLLPVPLAGVAGVVYSVIHTLNSLRDQVTEDA